MYSYASQGNVRALRAAVQRGLNIDSRDRFGNTGLCHAILQDNCTAYNAFRSAGANPRASCIQNIPTQQYDEFMDQSCAAAITDTPRQAYNKFNEGEFIISNRTWIIGGILLAGGLVAILAGGGGGGGGNHYYFVPYEEPDDSLAKFSGTRTPTSPESSPYIRIKYYADDNKTIVNKAEGSETNDFSISNNSSLTVRNADGTQEDKLLVDLIDLNGNILDYAAYLQVGMKARNNSTVINGSETDSSDAPMITLGDATVGLAADDRSQALNYGTLTVLAQNAALGMVAGNHSTATNQGGDINLQFRGFNDTDTVIGMYADTYSSIINNGNITGNTINVGNSGGGSDSGSDGTDGTDTTTANAGTIIGMEVRNVNEVPYPNQVDPATASNNASITLNAQSDSAAIKTSLIGMGGYLDQDFLDGTKLIRRAGSLYLFNGENGNISLNYALTGSGTYAPDTNTLLKGNGGIVGMRADAKTYAVNDGKISLLMSSGVNNAGAGMQAVHGGSITNNNEISVTGGTGNYGMLSVRGQGSNSEIDSLLPTLVNGINGSITVNSTDGFGMASFNGGSVTNNGSITMVSKGTGMRTNNGTLTNSDNASIVLQNNGAGMVIKSGDPTTDASTGSDGEGDASGDGTGTGTETETGTETGDTSGETTGNEDSTGNDAAGGNTGSTVTQDLSRAQAINNGSITINNADDAMGIFIEDGTAINNGRNGQGIFITNTSRVPTTASYGIKAEKGTVENNGVIDMNVLVSADGSSIVDSYGIFSDSANINNNVNGSIVFRKRGTGIATTSGRVINMGSISLEQGGTGISSSNGDVYNVENATITINDNNTAASTGIVAQAGKITNDGTITITNGNGATGIKAGLLVDNNNLIEMTGRNVTGIELTGQDATANNNADINITSNGISENNYGIKAGASAVNATIINNDDIILTGDNNYLSSQQRGYGISIADGTADNKGKITFNDMYGWGMYTTAGTITNSTGTITLNDGGTGMYGSGSTAQIINRNDITINVPNNNNQALSYGLYADGGASANNTAGAEIRINSSSSISQMLSDAFGIYVNQGNGSNLGSIIINGSNSTGMAYAGTGTSDSTNDHITNMEGGRIDLTGSYNFGMTAAGGTAINAGIINVGVRDEDGTLTQSTNSIGMQTTGGTVSNQEIINVNSADSVGLQSDAENGTIINNGTINIADEATNSYAILSNAGSATNGVNGIINSNQSNTDLMKSTGGALTNDGTLNINDGLSNVNAMHIQGANTITNSAGATINVGQTEGAAGTNNVGMLVDGGSVVNKGNINIYTKDSFGIKLINNSEDDELVNEGTITVMEGADGSVALYAQNGDIRNKGTINMYGQGILMEAVNGEAYNEGTISMGNNSTAISIIGDQNAENSGNISIDGNNSNAYLIQGAGTITNQETGKIEISGSNSYGFKVEDGFAATLVNEGRFVLDGDGRNSFAMAGANANLTNSGTINVLQSSSTAMFTTVGQLINSGIITLDGENSSGLSVGGNGSATHGNTSGDALDDDKTSINVNASGAKAMAATGGGTLTNNALINVNASGAYGLYGTGGSTLVNNDRIFIKGGGYGMYASGSGTTATNNNNITLNINSNENGLLYGMYATASGSVTNAADKTISIIGSTNPDDVLASAFGIYANGGTATNAGTISVNGSNVSAMGASGGTLNNAASGTINLIGSGLTGMNITGGNATNSGSINLGSGGSTAPNSVGILASGGSATNAGTINVNSANSVGLQSKGGTVTNNGDIIIANNASGSYAFLSNSGSAINGTSGTVTSNLSNTDIMRAMGGNITNNGTLSAVNTASNVNVMHVASGGTASNTKTINVGTSTAATGTGNFGMLVDGTATGSATNSGNINVNSDNSFGMSVNNANGTITNTGIISIMSGASGSVAMNSENGTAYNRGTINMNVAGTIMRANNGRIVNERTLAVNYANSTAMRVTGNGSAQNASGGTITVTRDNSYAMAADDGEAATLSNAGTININSGASGSYAMYGTGASLTNETSGTINILQSATTAMFTKVGELINKGKINLNVANSIALSVNGSGSATNSAGATIAVNQTGSTAMLADGTGGRITNNGNITISANNSYALRATNGSTATNTTSISIGDSYSGTYAMYGTNNSSLVNSGNITVGRNSTAAIYAENSSVRNSGTLTVNSAQTNAYGIYADNASGSEDITNTNVIDVNYTGSGSAYGIYTLGNQNVDVVNGRRIDVSATSGTAYGMYGSGASLENNNSINVTGNIAYGMYSSGGSATNTGTITVTGTGSGTAYGMYGSGASLENNNSINVTGNRAYGMYSSGGSATNTGTITVTGTGSGTVYGMFGSGGADLVNSGTIKVNGTNAVGMYATGSGSTITNTGNIILNGSSIVDEHPGESTSENPDPDPDNNPTGCTGAGCGNFIQVANGATFVNSGQVISTSALNFNLMSAANSGTYVLAPKGSYIAPEYSGPVTASADIVMEGNKTTYVNEDSFIGTDAGLKLSSGSYLFDAYLVTNEDGNQDVVMTMKEFSDVVDNSSVANFLTNNYTLGTNMDMYSILKSAPDASSFTAAVAGQMGLDIVPSFAKQNMDIVKAVNRHMSQSLFANQSSKDVRAMFDFVYDYREQDGVNLLSGYEDNAATAYAMFDRKYNNNFRYGLGVSFTRYESDYDNGSSRDEVVAQILTPLIYTTEGLKAISMPRLGIGWGEYKRRTGGEENKADIKNYYYGVSNEVRKEINFGTLTLEPTAEFNILGLYQDNTKEKNGLEVKSSNNLSVEGGLGLYARKSFSIMAENDLTLRAGGSWYHEFNNPYRAARARIANMLGSYQMDAYDVERDRGILSVRMDYKHEGFDFYFEANKFLEEDDGYALSAGLGYRF